MEKRRDMIEFGRPVDEPSSVVFELFEACQEGVLGSQTINFKKNVGSRGFSAKRTIIFASADP